MDIKTAGNITNVKKAGSGFLPKVSRFSVKASASGIKTVGKAVKSTARTSKNALRTVNNAQKAAEEAQNSRENAAAAAHTTAVYSGAVMWQYRLLKNAAVKNLIKLANKIRAAVGARFIAKASAAAVRIIAKLAIQFGVPVLCMLLVCVVVLSLFGFCGINTTYNGLISMPVENIHVGVSAEYGWRICPFHGRELHTGIDFTPDHHCNVLAAQSGDVWVSKESPSYGNYVVLRHRVNGMVFYTLYAHLSQRLVAEGDEVLMGQIIGLEGGGPNDPGHGDSTGDHLHFEYRNEEYQSEDPRLYLNYWDNMMSNF